MKIAIEKFWCVKYYKAQPYNMEHTLCVCKVQFVIPGEEPYIDIIPASYLRGAVPTRMSKLEKEFFDKA